MTAPNSNDEIRTPKDLAEKLFSALLMQNMKNPREVGGQVIGFLTEALLYAATSTKSDLIAILTETIINTISAMPGDENARKELFKYVGDTIANVAASGGKPSADQAPAKP